MNMKSLVVAFLMAGFPVLAAQAACEPYDGFVLEGGTATDPRTGLTWKRCVVGQAWDEKHKKCKGGVRPLDWFDAMDVAVSDRDGGHDDWRLPSSYEIWSLFYCKTENTYWHGGVSTRHSYPVNFNVFPLPDREYGEIWTASSPGNDNHILDNERFSPLQEGIGFKKPLRAEVFRLDDDTYNRFHSAIGRSYRGYENWVLLVRGGGVNPHFEKAKERRVLQKELDEAIGRAYQAIHDNQVMRIEKLENELYEMDHSPQKE
jgi:hypothetical protein